MTMRYSNKYKRGLGPLKALFFLIMAIFFVVFLGTVVMILWNAILPDVAGFKPLNWWQAIGLLLLSRILFGGFHMGQRGERKWSRKRRQWKEKWRNMSAEERVAFKEKWRQRRGKCGPEGQDRKEDGLDEGTKIEVE